MCLIDITILPIVMPALQQYISNDDAIVSRKPHIGYYTGAESVWIPETDVLEDIHALLADTAAKIEGTVFLFYGNIERDKRPALEFLLREESRPDWLLDVAKGSGSQPWVLYEYAPEKAGS